MIKATAPKTPDQNILFLNERIRFNLHCRLNELGIKLQSKKISNDQELIQSDPISCPQNQKGNN